MEDLRPILERISYNLSILRGLPKSLDEFREKKRNYHLGLLKSNIELLQRRSEDIPDPSTRKEVIRLAFSLDVHQPEVMSQSMGELSRALGGLTNENSPKQAPLIPLKSLSIPSEIKADIMADLREIERCFQAGCFRSVAILCGRVLEVALHRKYFDLTGVDLLEKAPGIGLGKIIAKLSENETGLDPGLTQQIHLINQVRIYSVHVKQQAFNPNKNQSHAMILYTFDILEKLFLPAP